MKKGIHPEYFQIEITCGGCGTVHLIGTTVKEINITVCSECHPFYTGKQKLVDAEGRVDRFRKKYGNYRKPGEEKKE